MAGLQDNRRLPPRQPAAFKAVFRALEAIAAGDLVATLPHALLATRARDLELIEPPLPLPPFTLVAAWHRRVDSDPAHRWLRDRVGEICINRDA